MSRGIDGDDPFEDEEYARRVEQERADRRAEKAPLIEPKLGHVPPEVAARQVRVYGGLLGLPVPTPEQELTARLEMACLQCGAGMIRGTQCRRCGAWCR